MQQTRRRLLASGIVALSGAVAGCTEDIGNTADSGDNEGENGDGEKEDGGDSDGNSDRQPSVDAAVVAEWNAMRARVHDALALGLAGSPDAGAGVAQHVFERFEGASGEYGAHEALESTSESDYESFEESLGELRSEGLQAGNTERSREEASLATDHLASAQQARLGDEAGKQYLEMGALGVRALDAGFLADAGAFDAAATIAENVGDRFDEDLSSAVESDTAETFQGALDGVVSAAENEDADGVRSESEAAFEAAIGGSYALAPTEHAAGAGHIAALQAWGWDAHALASTGGPGQSFAHAATLTIYRARIHDATWLAAAGATERAATMVGDVFAHFEGARAHEGLEEADHEAYEGFEDGLSSLQSAIESGDGVDDALATVDEALVSGIGALVGEDAMLLESAFFRARLADARERYLADDASAAATIAEGVFERFEANELDLHESIEDTDEALYERFEEEHLAGVIDAFEAGNDEGVETHYEGVIGALDEFERTAGTTATVSGAEAAVMSARGFDAATVDTLDADDRAAAIARASFERFESDPGGYHEALENADESVYETFEDELGAIATAAEDSDDVYPVAKRFDGAAIDSAYAIVGGAGGRETGAADRLGAAFAHFEEARVHELIEEADHNAYETFEAHLDAYREALDGGNDVTAAAEGFARAAQYAQFAIVDAAEDVPVDLDLAGAGGGGEESGEGGNRDLEGGPNVVEGVPDDADHVVDMNAVAFSPAELTVEQGDTVAWVHAAGEPHSVTAVEDSLPEGTEYWASGDFDSEEAAREGWEEGVGAVADGQAYVHTFETTGTHEYVCIPHEAAGMAGSVTVE